MFLETGFWIGFHLRRGKLTGQVNGTDGWVIELFSVASAHRHNHEFAWIFAVLVCLLACLLSPSRPVVFCFVALQ